MPIGTGDANLASDQMVALAQVADLSLGRVPQFQREQLAYSFEPFQLPHLGDAGRTDDKGRAVKVTVTGVVLLQHLLSRVLYQKQGEFF